MKESLGACCVLTTCSERTLFFGRVLAKHSASSSSRPPSLGTTTCPSAVHSSMPETEHIVHRGLQLCLAAAKKPVTKRLGLISSD